MPDLFPDQGYTPKFERFYARYPRKMGASKRDAHKAWMQVRGDQQYAAIMDGLDRFPFSPDSQFQPHAATWLRQRRWEIVEDTPAVTKSVPAINPKPSKTAWMEGYENPGHFIEVEADHD